MDIIREHCKQRCIVRTDTYASTLGHLEMLFAEARNDFPGLVQDRVEIVHYGGRSYARTYGLEFDVEPTQRIPDSYKAVQEVELKL